MGQSIQSDIFDYAVFFEKILNDGIPLTKPLVIQSDADFEVQSLQASITTGAAGPFVADSITGNHFPGLYINITNTGNGQKWSNIPMMVPCLFGTGQNPFMLPVTQVMERNAAYEIELVNKGVADLDRATFVFSGRKLLP